MAMTPAESMSAHTISNRFCTKTADAAPIFFRPFRPRQVRLCEIPHRQMWRACRLVIFDDADVGIITSDDGAIATGDDRGIPPVGDLARASIYVQNRASLIFRGSNPKMTSQLFYENVSATSRIFLVVMTSRSFQIRLSSSWVIPQDAAVIRVMILLHRLISTGLSILSTVTVPTTLTTGTDSNIACRACGYALGLLVAVALTTCKSPTVGDVRCC